MVKLARRYGVEGFVVYHYNFGARRLLHAPIDNLMKQPDVDFRFALCWANENWTKHWDGGTRSILPTSRTAADVLERLDGKRTLRSLAADTATVRLCRELLELGALRI